MTTNVKIKLESTHDGKTAVVRQVSPRDPTNVWGTNVMKAGDEITLCVHDHARLVIDEIDAPVITKVVAEDRLSTKDGAG